MHLDVAGRGLDQRGPARPHPEIRELVQSFAVHVDFGVQISSRKRLVQHMQDAVAVEIFLRLAPADDDPSQ